MEKEKLSVLDTDKSSKEDINKNQIEMVKPQKNK